MSEFIFSEKNEEFIKLLTELGTALRNDDKNGIELAKAKYAKYKIILGFKDDTNQIVLMAEGGKPCYFDLDRYDGVKEAEIIKE